MVMHRAGVRRQRGLDVALRADAVAAPAGAELEHGEAGLRIHALARGLTAVGIVRDVSHGPFPAKKIARTMCATG